MERKEVSGTVVTFRIFQAIFLGVFVMGLSMMAGDYSTFVKSPISALSITTTIFGLGGALISGFQANRAERW